MLFFLIMKPLLRSYFFIFFFPSPTNAFPVTRCADINGLKKLLHTLLDQMIAAHSGKLSISLPIRDLWGLMRWHILRFFIRQTLFINCVIIKWGGVCLFHSISRPLSIRIPCSSGPSTPALAKLRWYRRFCTRK